MGKVFITILMICLIIPTLAGCGEAHVEGIVLDVNEDNIMLATELSQEAYEEIKNIPASDIQNGDVNGDTYLGLITLTYHHTDGINKGDRVAVWIDGDIMESYPMKAKASKISKKD